MDITGARWGLDRGEALPPPADPVEGRRRWLGPVGSAGRACHRLTDGGSPVGSALIMMVVPEEMLGMSELYTRNAEGELVPVAKRRDGMWVRREDVERALRQHPDAFYMMRVPYGAVWRPPEEPTDTEGFDWHWRPEILAAHREKVRVSLEGFLNRNLAQLDQMVRTVWFIIERARAAIVDFTEVPHRLGEIERRGASKGKSKG